MRILVISDVYPSDENNYGAGFIHSRNIAYKKLGHSCVMLCISSTKTYYYEGIKVFSVADFFMSEENLNNYDLLLVHAPNFKMHIPIIKKLQNKVGKVVFVIHGHEVLRERKYYPKPYDFKRKNKLIYNLKFIKKFIRDEYKLKILNKYFKELININKCYFIFVSEWMKIEFLNSIQIQEEDIKGNYRIIHNNANDAFFAKDYETKENEYLADFVTIRPLDNPKYSMDTIVKLAEANQNLTFDVYGKGDYFNYNKRPKNLRVHNKFLKQKDIPQLLDQYRAGLMLTRLDSQGVMMCEFATYGIPLITSDIPICREMLADFDNVFYINNSSENLTAILKQISFHDQKRNMKFSIKNTVQKELELFNEIMI